MSITRRNFCKTIAISTGAAAIGNAAQTYCRQIPQVAFGATGLYASRLGLEASHLHFASTLQEANHTVRYLLDSGVNYIDTSPYYGAGYAETLLGKIVSSQRENVILATKTRSIDKQFALLELDESLQRLQTDYVDVWLIDNPHKNNIDRYCADDGVLSAAIQAKEQGKCRFIGIAGQSHPQWTLAFIERFQFDVVHIPLNAVDPHHFSFEQETLPELDRNDTATVGCKTYAMDTLRSSGHLSQQDALHYALSLPVLVTLVNPCNKEQARRDVSAFYSFTELTSAAKEKILAHTKPLSSRDVEWYKAMG